MTTRDLPCETLGVVRGVLGEYLSRHPCLCGWPQFRFWAGKEQGPGWMDEIQNSLVACALGLRLFRREPPALPSYLQEDDAVCTVCGTRWRHFRYEWRMLAFQERLIPDGTASTVLQGFDHRLTGEWIFATAGYGPPVGDPVLAIRDWESFMLGRPFHTMPRAPEDIR